MDYKKFANDNARAQAAQQRLDNMHPEPDGPELSEAVPCARCGGAPVLNGTGETKDQFVSCTCCGRWPYPKEWTEERAVEVWNAWQAAETQVGAAIAEERLRRSHAELLAALEECDRFLTTRGQGWVNAGDYGRNVWKLTRAAITNAKELTR